MGAVAVTIGRGLPFGMCFTAPGHAKIEIVRALHLGDRDLDQHLQRTQIDAADDLLHEREVRFGRANEQRVARLLGDDANVARLTRQRAGRLLERVRQRVEPPASFAIAGVARGRHRRPPPPAAPTLPPRTAPDLPSASRLMFPAARAGRWIR